MNAITSFFSLFLEYVSFECLNSLEEKRNRRWEHPRSVYWSKSQQLHVTSFNLDFTASSGRHVPKASSKRFSSFTDFSKSVKDSLPSWSWSCKINDMLFCFRCLMASLAAIYQSPHHLLQYDLHQVFNALVRVLLTGLPDQAVLQHVKHLFPGDVVVTIQIIDVETI